MDGLTTFLTKEGNTLLIKGYAGAGKTTLALSLLGELAPNGRGVYVSSRVSQSKVHRELPWAEFGSGGKASMKRFEDVRLGSPKYFMEAILRAISKKGRSAPPVVVIDTWDGIAKEMARDERLKAEKMLIAAADGSLARVVFVSEEPDRTTMDYLVDGVVELRREEWYGRVFREMELVKLRGTMIDQHKYLYTLDGGRFSMIPSYPDSRSAPRPRARRPKTIPDQDGSVSFGSPHLDSVFGGMKMGSAFSLVYDESIPYSAVRLLTVPAAVNALNLGKGVFYAPLPGTINKEVAGALRPYVDPDAFRNCLAIGSVGGESKGEPPLYSISAQQPRDAAARVNDLVSIVRNNSQTKSVLMIESLAMFEALFASRLETMVESVGERANAVHSSGTDSVMFLIQSESPICKRTLALSSRYAKLCARNRSVVIFGEKPDTPAYALGHAKENPLLASLKLIV